MSLSKGWDGSHAAPLCLISYTQRVSNPSPTPSSPPPLSSPSFSLPLGLHTLASRCPLRLLLLVLADVHTRSKRPSVLLYVVLLPVLYLHDHQDRRHVLLHHIPGRVRFLPVEHALLGAPATTMRSSSAHLRRRPELRPAAVNLSVHCSFSPALARRQLHMFLDHQTHAPRVPAPLRRLPLALRRPGPRRSLSALSWLRTPVSTQARQQHFAELSS